MVGGCTANTKTPRTSDTKPEEDLVANDKDNNEDAEIVVEGEETAEMTKQQEEVFRSYGLSEEEITKMKEKGLDYKQQSFADTAIIMLTYLEEKYGESFEVVSGDIPGVLSDEYWITAQASDGAHAGEEFDVYYRGNEGCTDGYIGILKEEEACEAFERLIKEKISNVQVFSEITGEYGSEITLEMTGDQLLLEVTYSFTIVITDPDMTEEEFNQKADEIETFIGDSCLHSMGGVYCFVNKVESDLTMNEVDDIIEDDNKLVVKWGRGIVTYGSVYK